ncbi:MAG: shikimate kinase, partial [Deltaproteobacteria bacterium]|nr:shikimate kinase [Deltaproteobacteria bacterium]
MIFLTGFMGSGKTSLGKELAKVLKLAFIDLDENISCNAGTKISEIFSSAGEKAF